MPCSIVCTNSRSTRLAILLLVLLHQKWGKCMETYRFVSHNFSGKRTKFERDTSFYQFRGNVLKVLESKWLHKAERSCTGTGYEVDQHLPDLGGKKGGDASAGRECRRRRRSMIPEAPVTSQQWRLLAPRKSITAPLRLQGWTFKYVNTGYKKT